MQRNRFSLVQVTPMAAVGEGSAASFADAVGASDAPATPQIANGKKFSYFFKTEAIKDEDGKKIGDGRKHPTVEAVLPVPQAADIIEALSYVGETEKAADGKTDVATKAAKVAALILETVQDLIYQAGRGQINDFLDKDPKGTFTATNFDLNKLTLEAVALMDRGSRGAWAPAEDDLKAFNEDYTNIMVQEVQYEAKRVKVHCDQFTKGFAKIKNDKVALGKMQEFLVGYAARTQNMDDNAQTYEWLVARLKKYISAEEKNFADAL